MYVHTEEVHNLKAPGVIVPDLISEFRPRSVVDVGCGIGTFLSVFVDNGVTDVLGIDGDWVDRKKLYLDRSLFLEADLQNPPDVNRQFDLALCLEVAEHLPPHAAEGLVRYLCSLSKVIVFSAAIPGQGGENHFNEQPAEYWQQKFLAHDYYFFDVFRTRYWNHDEIDWWYKQNMFLVAHGSVDLPKEILIRRSEVPVDTRVHPDPFFEVSRELDQLRSTLDDLKTVKGLMRTIPRFARRKLFQR